MSGFRFTMDHDGDFAWVNVDDEEAFRNTLAEVIAHSPQEVFPPETSGSSDLFAKMLRALPAPFRMDRNRLGFFMPFWFFDVLREGIQKNQEVTGPIRKITVFGVRAYPVPEHYLPQSLLLTYLDNWPELMDWEGIVIVHGLIKPLHLAGGLS